MTRAHGIIGLLPVAAQRAFSARIAAGDHRPAIHDADPVPAALTAEAQPVFRSVRSDEARAWPNAYREAVARRIRAECPDEDARVKWICALAEDLRVMHRIEVIYGREVFHG